MDEITKKHYQINAARRVKESLDYINSNLDLLKDKSPEEAYIIVASAFRSYAFDQLDWENLKDSQEYMPQIFKDKRNVPYKTAIKKISDEMHKKANPSYEKDKREQEQEEKKRLEEEPSIFEDDSYQKRKMSSDARSSSNVSMGGSDISFNIIPDVRTEETVVRLVAQGEIAEAHELMCEFIFEQLQGQLSTKDLEKALMPGDFKISKPISFRSTGISKTIQVRNRSLVDTLASAHLGLIVMKAKLKEKEKVLRERMKQKGVNLEKAIEGEILETDKHALGKLVVNNALADDTADLSPEEIEHLLCPLCEEIKKTKEELELSESSKDKKSKEPEAESQTEIEEKSPEELTQEEIERLAEEEMMLSMGLTRRP